MNTLASLLGAAACAACLVLASCSTQPTSAPSESEGSADVEDGSDDRPEPVADDGRAAPGRLDASTRDAAIDAAPTHDGAALLDARVSADAAKTSAGEPGPRAPWLNAAPRAKCSEGDMPDQTLSGLSGDYHCNLQVAGQVEAPHFLSLAWHGDCAYVNGADGTTVIRVSPEGTPTVTTTLTTVGFRSNWESMKASPASGLLVGYESNGSMFTVYNVAKDCSQPVLESSTSLGSTGSLGHAGSFSPDGTLYYASSFFSGAVFAVDLAMPAKPVIVSEDFDRGSHDLFIGRGGKRGYFAFSDIVQFNVGIFAIMDLTDVQARKPGAKGTLIKEFTWEDGSATQYPIAVRYRGEDFLIISDELGSGNCDNAQKPQWSYAHIFDIRDELNPKLVARVKTEAQDPTNCQAAAQASGGTSGFGVGTHYCNVDRLDDPRVLACGNWDGGLRVYDIRDPWRPRELAYFDTKTANMPGLARILPERQQIWIAVTPGTFYVLKVAEGSELAAILEAG